MSDEVIEATVTDAGSIRLERFIGELSVEVWILPPAEVWRMLNKVAKRQEGE